MQLAHVASAQGINAVCAMAGKDMPIDTRVVPSCIYTSPEIASVGLTADAAKEQGIETNVGKFIMSANAKSVIENAPRGFIKIVADAKTDVVLGAQLMCSRATDMLPILSCAVANKQTVPDLLKAMYPHPTFCEGIGEALEDVHGGAVHILPKRR